MSIGARAPLAALLAFGATLAAGAGAPFVAEAGKHYREVTPPIAVSAPAGQVEVIEFFSLGCPACAGFEPYLQSWLKRKPAGIAFKRVPVVFNPPFRLLAKVQFALTDVGAADRLTPQVFEALHSRKDPALVRPLGAWQVAAQKNDPAATAAAEKELLAAFGAFVAARGVDRAKFDAALRSPSVAIRLAQADALFKRYGGTGVPALAVDGRWFTHTARPFSFNSYDEFLGTVDQLARRAGAR